MSEVANREEWMRRTGPLYPGIIALRRQTALPILSSTETTDDDLRRAAGWSSLIGAGLGAMLAIVALTFAALDVSPTVAAAFVVLVGLIATGAQHERGLATTVERLAGTASYTRQTLGAPGVIALFATLGLRGACLVGTNTDAWIGALIVSQTVIPAVSVLLLKVADHTDAPLARGRGLMFGVIGWGTVGVAAGVAAVASLVFGGVVGLLTLIVAGLCAFGLGLALQRRDGGVGTDTLASIALACELVVLLGFAIAYPG